MTAVDSFKALGDPVRLRLFYLLSLNEELCVCQLTGALRLPQSTVSRQLAVLRHAGLVDTRRNGKWINYRLDGDMAMTLATVVRERPDDTQRADAERLASEVQPCR